MQSSKVRVDWEQRTQECLKQLAQYYHELKRMPKNFEIDEMARKNGGHRYFTMKTCLGPKEYWLERLRSEGYIDDVQDVQRESLEDAAKIDGFSRQQRTGCVERRSTNAVASEAVLHEKVARKTRRTSRQRRQLTSREMELEERIKDRWGKPRTIEEARAFEAIDAQTTLTPEEKLWLRVAYLGSRGNE